MKLLVFLPCKPYSEKGNDIDRVIHALIPSCVWASSQGSISFEIAIAVPDINFTGVHEKFTELWRESDQNIFTITSGGDSETIIRLISESTLCAKPSGINPWVYQQLLKLSFCSLSHGNFKHVLLLDSDIIFTRPVLYSELFFIDRARLSNLSKRAFNAQNHWWRASATALGLEVVDLFESLSKIRTEEGLMKPRIGITPQILSTEVVHSLIELLTIKANGLPWHEYLWKLREEKNTPWTEYSLYWLHLINNFDYEDYYVCDTRKLYDGSLDRSAEYNKQVKTFLDSYISQNSLLDIPPFYVNQSTVCTAENHRTLYKIFKSLYNLLSQSSNDSYSNMNEILLKISDHTQRDFITLLD